MTEPLVVVTANNGRISQMTDNLSGETVQYTYDQLNRLISGEQHRGNDEFRVRRLRKLTQQGSTTLSVDVTTNRINSSGYQYNANGNLVAAPGGATYSYDVSNRLVSNGAIYNPRNQRVYDGTYFYLYTPGAKVLGKYTANWSQNQASQAVIVGQPNVYFAGRLLQEQGHW